MTYTKDPGNVEQILGISNRDRWIDRVDQSWEGRCYGADDGYDGSPVLRGEEKFSSRRRTSTVNTHKAMSVSVSAVRTIHSWDVHSSTMEEPILGAL